MTNTPQFVLVPVEDFQALAAEVRTLSQRIERATIIPASEWVTIPQATAQLDVSVATIRRRIDSGEIQAKGSGKLRRVRVNPNA